ncbi:MxaD protein [Candidatus Wolfebacteria bacterium]|nr:MAG: MxaD protein [Candidatus Wolfebacteria bacterium]
MSQIEETRVYSATPAEVWDKIGDPGKINEWHPVIPKCETDGDNRTCTLSDGAVIKEQIISHDDEKMIYTYKILESPLPIRNYESSVSVTPEGDGAKVTWASQFEVVDAPADEIEGAIRGIYVAGLENLDTKFS